MLIDVSHSYGMRCLLFHTRSARIKTTYFANNDGSDQKPKSKPLSRNCRPFLGPLAAILDLAWGAVLQAVQCCKRSSVASDERLPQVMQGCYS